MQQSGHALRNFYTVENPFASPPCGRSKQNLNAGWAEKRNGFATVSAIAAKIGFINSDDYVIWIQLAHSNQAKVS